MADFLLGEKFLKIKYYVDNNEHNGPPNFMHIKETLFQNGPAFGGAM